MASRRGRDASDRRLRFTRPELFPLSCFIPFSCAPLRPGYSTHVDANRTEAAITRLVSGVVAEAVLAADLSGDLCEGGAGGVQVGRLGGSAAGVACELVHLLACELIERTTDRHTLERSQAAEVGVVGAVRTRIEGAAV